MNNTKDFLEFTQGEHDDLVERVANCENEQSTYWAELTHLNIYSRLRFRVLGASFSRFRGLRFRSRVLRFRVLGASFSSLGCFVLRSSFSSASFSKLPLNLPQDEVSNMKLCGAHGLRKPNRTQPDLSLLANDSRFTWRNKSLKIQCRLEFFLISKELSSDTPACNIINAPETDHSVITLHLKTEDLFGERNSRYFFNLERRNRLKKKSQSLNFVTIR